MPYDINGWSRTGIKQLVEHLVKSLTTRFPAKLLKISLAIRPQGARKLRVLAQQPGLADKIISLSQEYRIVL